MTKAKLRSIKEFCQQMQDEVTSDDWRIEFGDLIYVAWDDIGSKHKHKIASMYDKTELSVSYASYLTMVQPSEMLKLLDLIDVESLPDA